MNVIGAYKKSLFSASSLGLLLGLAFAPSANSALIVDETITYVNNQGQTIEVTGSPFAGNDCSGILGQGFENCSIPDSIYEGGSPIIVKFNFDDEGNIAEEDGIQIYSEMFASITGDEFSFVFAEDYKSGTWYYTAGLDDPLITHYAAKGGNYFNLYTADGSECSVTSPQTQCGVWVTPIVGNKQFGTSHLSFYDSEGGGGGGGSVPEPGVLFLMGAGLLGLGMAHRRKSA